jgi:hypothetical protein
LQVLARVAALFEIISIMSMVDVNSPCQNPIFRRSAI